MFSDYLRAGQLFWGGIEAIARSNSHLSRGDYLGAMVLRKMGVSYIVGSWVVAASAPWRPFSLALRTESSESRQRPAAE